MATIRETIIDTIADNAAAISALGATVYRERVTPLARGEFPAVIIEPVTDRPSFSTSNKVDWQLTLRVMVLARATNATTVADEIMRKVYLDIMGDPTIGGYANDVLPSATSWDLIDADIPVSIVTQDFEASYRTSLIDLSAV